MTVSAQLATFTRDVAKTLGFYALIGAAGFVLISVWLGSSFKEMWLPYLLFFIPAFVSIHLVYRATQVRDRPKAFALRFAFAMGVFCLLVTVAMYHSGLLNWMVGRTSVPGVDALDDAVRLLWSGKIDQGMRALRSLAEKGNVKAQLFLGHGYAHENPTVKHVDYSEAMKWFKRASGQGSGEGSAAIAELYEQGLGVTKSSEEAQAWWELAAKQGYDQQELDVRCFTRTPGAGSLTCEPFSDGSGCPTNANMETLRAVGVTGRLKPTGGGGGRFRLGPKARALIVLDHRIISEQRLKQPRHTNIIYVQHETGWVVLPTNAPLLDRPIVLSPQPDAAQFTMAGVQDVDGSISAGGCATWK